MKSTTFPRLMVSVCCLGWGCGQIDDDDHTTLLSLLKAEVVAEEQVDWSTTPYQSLLSNGDYHGCAIQGTKLYCWGDNSNGLLGTNSGSQLELSPVAVAADQDWKHVCSSSSHNCAIQLDGSLYCWGDNSHGQLGTNNQNNSMLPVAVESTEKWQHASCGNSFSCAVTENGALHCWGKNDWQLGSPDFDSPQLTPGEVEASGWMAVWSGSSHSCALKTDGSLWCWGGWGWGECGGELDTRPQSPTLVAEGKSWTDVSTKHASTCAIEDNGTMACFGFNNNNYLGVSNPNPDDNETQHNVTYPGTNETGVTSFQSVDVGGFASCGIGADAKIWCWGGNNDGELPDGIEAAALPAVELDSSQLNGTAQSVSLGRNHICVSDSNQSVWCVGANRSGQLGLGVDDHPVKELEQLVFP